MCESSSAFLLSNSKDLRFATLHTMEWRLFLDTIHYGGYAFTTAFNGYWSFFLLKNFALRKNWGMGEYGDDFRTVADFTGAIGWGFRVGDGVLAEMLDDYLRIGK
jgi:hypothetical protein